MESARLHGEEGASRPRSVLPAGLRSLFRFIKHVGRKARGKGKRRDVVAPSSPKPRDRAGATTRASVPTISRDQATFMASSGHSIPFNSRVVFATSAPSSPRAPFNSRVHGSMSTAPLVSSGAPPSALRSLSMPHSKIKASGPPSKSNAAGSKSKAQGSEGSIPRENGSSSRALAIATRNLQLRCTLEELYNGSHRRVLHTRNVTSSDGVTRKKHRPVSLKVLPGFKHGSVIMVYGAGDRVVGQLRENAKYEVEELPHATFTRDGHDLLMTKTILLVEALTGCAFVVKTLDGRDLVVKVEVDQRVLGPGCEVVVEGEGMPVYRRPGRYGRLIITLVVVFPTSLSMLQKAGLKSLLSLPVR